MGRCGGTAIDPDALDSCGFADVTGGRCDVCGGLLFGGRDDGGLLDGGRYGCALAGVGPNCDGAGSELARAREPAGGSEPAGGGIDGGAYDTGPCGAAGLTPVVGRDDAGGYAASSWIFAVGASGFCSPLAGWRAPQPPQNRESSAFSVPQVVQRIHCQRNKATVVCKITIPASVSGRDQKLGVADV